MALGHVELIQLAATDQVIAEDARIAAAELARLRRLAQWLLLLASAGSPDFLQLAPVEAGSVVLDTVERWGHIPRRWRLGEVAEATVLADRDQLATALDALLENAVAHTAEGDRIEIGVYLEQGGPVFGVTDDGCGIPAAERDRIFGRFARARADRGRAVDGFGLGLPVVQAIAEAHHGSVRVRSTEGHGATLEIQLPAAPEPEHVSS